MAALAANAVKSQRRKAANKLAEQALSNINEQRQFLATVAQKHRDSLSSVSTLDSYRQYEVKLIDVVWKLMKIPLFPFHYTFSISNPKMVWTISIWIIKTVNTILKI